MHRPLPFMFATFLFCIFMLFTPAELKAQTPIHHSYKYLALKKRNTYLGFFKTGDILKVKLKNRKGWVEYTLLGVTGTHLKVDGGMIGIGNIRKIHFKEGSRRGYLFLSSLLVTAGAFYLFTDQFNTIRNINDGYQVDHQSLLIGGGLIGAGLLSSQLHKEKFNLGVKYRLLPSDFRLKKSGYSIDGIEM